MANDNQAGSRTFLAIVLGGIVLALVIAAYFMYGSRQARPSVESRAARAGRTRPPAPAAPPMAAPEAAPPGSRGCAAGGTGEHRPPIHRSV